MYVNIIIVMTIFQNLVNARENTVNTMYDYKLLLSSAKNNYFNNPLIDINDRVPF